MDSIDYAVRMAAFRFLDEQTRLAGEDGAVRRTTLERGFEYNGQRVPLVGPQGIFKPKVLNSIPLSITTVPVIEEESRPYDDESDGPMLIHGLQGFHGSRLHVPRQAAWKPNVRLLEERYNRFRQALP